MGKIIGIDLGTTNSVVAIMEGDTPTVYSMPMTCYKHVARLRPTPSA